MDDKIKPKTEEPELSLPSKIEQTEDELVTPLSSDETLLLSNTDNEQVTNGKHSPINEFNKTSVSDQQHSIVDKMVTNSQYSIAQPTIAFSCERTWDSYVVIPSEIVLHGPSKKVCDSASVVPDMKNKPPTEVKEKSKENPDSDYDIIFCIAAISRTTPNDSKLLAITKMEKKIKLDIKSDRSSLNGYAADRSSSSSNSAIYQTDELFLVPKVPQDSFMSSSSSSSTGVLLNQPKSKSNNILVSKNIYTYPGNLVCPNCNFVYPGVSEDFISDSKDFKSKSPIKSCVGKSRQKKEPEPDQKKTLKKTKENTKNISVEETGIKIEEFENNPVNKPENEPVDPVEIQTNVPISFDIGDKVFAYWVADKFFYPATIIDIVHTKFKVEFMSDCVMKSINAEGLVHSAALKQGFTVAIFDTVSQEYRVGEIVSINDVPYSEKTYTIDLGSEEIVVGFEKLVLDVEKARMLQDKMLFKNYDRLSMSNVSEGKRPCSSRSTNTKRINDSKAKTRNESIKRKKTSSETSKKRKCLFPEASDPKNIPSTSTGITDDNYYPHHVPVQHSSSDSDFDHIRENLNTINMGQLRNSDIDSEHSSPGSGNHIAKSSTNNNIKVFEGLTFCLSYAKYKRSSMFNDSDLSTDNDSLLNSDYFKSDKLYKPRLDTLIKKNGGTVIWYMNHIPKSRLKFSYLITDTPSQTCNFLLALAYGVPSYHHRCIEQAISKKIPFPEFLAKNNIQPLPNGVSLESKKVVFRSVKSFNNKIFSGYIMYVAFPEEDKTKFVACLLQLCGAIVYTSWGKDISMPLTRCINTTVIVTDENCPDALARAKVPKLSIVWVIQSLICESARPFDGHEHYISVNDVSDS